MALDKNQQNEHKKYVTSRIQSKSNQIYLKWNFVRGERICRNVGFITIVRQQKKNLHALRVRSSKNLRNIPVNSYTTIEYHQFYEVKCSL